MIARSVGEGVLCGAVSSHARRWGARARPNGGLLLRVPLRGLPHLPPRRDLLNAPPVSANGEKRPRLPARAERAEPARLKAAVVPGGKEAWGPRSGFAKRARGGDPRLSGAK